MDGVIARRFWESINIVLLWEALGTIWCLLMGGWNIPGSQRSSPLGSVHCSPPSLRAEANAAATLNQVPQGSLSPGQQYILVLIRAPLFTDVPQSWNLCVCVCHPQDPGDLPGCPHPALSALSKTLSLTEGWPLYQQTIHLIRELRNLSPLPKSALDLGSSIYRVLINCVLHCTAYDKTIL